MVIKKDAIAYKFEIKIKIQGSGIGPGLWSHYSYMISVLLKQVFTDKKC